MKGKKLIHLGVGLLFLNAGLGKLVTGLLGGFGLKGFAGMLSGIGFASLGETGTMVLATIVALVEALGGLVFLGAAFGCCTCGGLVKKAAWANAFVMVVALGLVHLPNLDLNNAESVGMTIMTVMILTTLLGIATSECCGAKK